MPGSRRDHQEGGEQVNTRDDIIGDKEAAELFGISVNTLRHHCMESHKVRKGRVDVRAACPVIVGRVRRWSKRNILQLLNCPVV